MGCSLDLVRRFLPFLVVACSSSPTMPQLQNAPPAWAGAPAMVHLVQGETKTIPVAFADPDKDAVKASVASTIESGFDEAMTTLTIHAPFDAGATDTVTVTLDDGRGGKKSYPIEVTIDPIAWKSGLSWTANGPIAREHGTFLLDDKSRTVFLLGGSGYQPQGMALDDFWKLDIPSGAWTKITPTGDVPQPTASVRAARLPGTTTAILFGGYTGSGMTETNDLFRVEFGGGQLVFKKLTQAAPPAARELHGFGFDPMSQKFVLFGGYSSTSGILADTWIMQLSGDAATWTKLAGAGPTPRYGFFFGTDEVAGRFFVYSGAQKAKGADPINAAQDTWALDLRADAPAWTQVLDGTEANHPPGRRNGCFVVDPRGPSMYVLGGTSDGMTTQPDLVALDMRAGHEGFSKIDRPNAPLIRSSGFGFYDPTAGAVNCGFGNSTVGVYTDVNSIGP
jgi:hypothetical protein